MNDNKEPIVLGKLKNEKSSKPIFVFVVFIMLIAVAFGLPYIQDYFSTSNNFITKLYNQYFGTDTTGEDNTNDTTITKDTIQLIDSDTTMVYDYLTLSGFSLSGNKITYSATSTNGILNLDEMTLYLEIYGNSQNLLTRIKLTGSYDNSETSITSILPDLTINSSSNYYGRIQSLSDDDYTDVTLTNNKLTCTDDNNTYVYNFSDNKLQTINHTYTYTDTTDLTAYMTKLNASNAKSSIINALTNCSSTTTETDDGFIYTAVLDLNYFKSSSLGDYIDYNYFDLNTLAKRVSYEMIAKGYDCQ